VCRSPPCRRDSLPCPDKRPRLREVPAVELSLSRKWEPVFGAKTRVVEPLRARLAAVVHVWIERERTIFEVMSVTTVMSTGIMGRIARDHEYRRCVTTATGTGTRQGTAPTLISGSVRTAIFGAISSATVRSFERKKLEKRITLVVLGHLVKDGQLAHGMSLHRTLRQMSPLRGRKILALTIGLKEDVRRALARTPMNSIRPGSRLMDTLRGSGGQPGEPAAGMTRAIQIFWVGTVCLRGCLVGTVVSRL
jgi:hypothetical protein